MYIIIKSIYRTKFVLLMILIFMPIINIENL